MLIGIDPGCSGALVATDNAGKTVLWWSLMPTVKLGKTTRMNGAALASELRHLGDDLVYGGIRHAYLEQVHAMPKQGVTSVFTFGHSLKCGLTKPLHGLLSGHAKSSGTRFNSRPMIHLLYPS